MQRSVTLVGSIAFVVAACGGTVFGENPDGSAPAQYASCTAPGQCLVVPKTCCGRCGTPTLDDMVSVSIEKDSAYRSSVCGGGTIACPDCAGMDEPNLVAVCRSTKCSAVDLRSDGMSACQVDGDCLLRAGNGCCEPCSDPDPHSLIAVSQSGYSELRANLCRPGDGPCSRCLVQYPPGYAATCDQTKHCVVTKRTLDAGTGG